jgi:hypothetical protein
MYLKFLTPLTPSVEKIVILHEFKEVYKPRNINLLFIQRIITAWQHISREVPVKGLKQCCISSALDVTDDGMLWNDNEEDGNVSECEEDDTDCEDGDSDIDW